MRPAILGLLLAMGCRPDPFVAAGPEERWRVEDPDGVVLGEARLAPAAGGGWVERIRTRDGAVEVEGLAAPGRCARRERLDRARWEASADPGGWTWRRGLERRDRPLAEVPAACLAEVPSPGEPGWRSDLVAWQVLLPDLPDRPGDGRAFRVLDLATGRLLDLRVEAREIRDLPVDGVPVPAVRAFAHTAGEGRVLWYAADRTRLLASSTPLERILLRREGVDLPIPPVLSPPSGVEELSWVAETPTQRLAGTLTRPAVSDAPLPVVILISGSGPVDRDGNVGGMRIWLQRTLAWRLADRGLAVLRYDKRGVGGSAVLGRERSFTLDDFAGDVKTWMDDLVAMPGLDPGRIFLVGHSEGGYIAPIVAGRDPRVRGVVILAGPVSRLDAIMQAQLRLLLAAHGADEAAVERAARIQAASLKVVAEGRDREVASPGWGTAAGDWMRSHLAHDPRAALEGVHVPLLAIFGREDLQVPVEEAGRMEAVLAGRPDARVVVLDGVDHLLMPVEGASGMGLYTDPDRQVDARVLELVETFLVDLAGRSEPRVTPPT